MMKILLHVVYFALAYYAISGFIIAFETNKQGVGLILYPALLIAIVLGLAMLKEQFNKLKSGTTTSAERIMGLTLSFFYLIPAIFFIYLNFIR